jgi:hypothetical protein
MVLKTKRIHKGTNRNTKKRGGGICLADPQRYHFSEFVHCKFEKYTGSNELVAYMKRSEIKTLPMFQAVINGKKDYLKILDYGIFIPNFFVNIDNYFDPEIYPPENNFNPEEKFLRLVEHKAYRKKITGNIRYECQNPKLQRLISFVENTNINEKVINTNNNDYEENLNETIKYLYTHESKGLFDDFYIKKVYGAVNVLGQSKKQVVNFFTGTNQERKNWQFFIFNFIKSLKDKNINIYEDTHEDKKRIAKNEKVINHALWSNGATSYLLDEENNRHLITILNGVYNDYIKNSIFDRNVDYFYKYIQSDLLRKYIDYIKCEKECFELVINKIKIVINDFDEYLVEVNKQISNDTNNKVFLEKKRIVLDNKDPVEIRKILNNTYINFKKIHAYLTLVYEFLLNTSSMTIEDRIQRINDSYNKAQKEVYSDLNMDKYYTNFNIYKLFFNSYIKYYLFKQIFECSVYKIFPLHNDIGLFLEKIKDNKLLSTILNTGTIKELLKNKESIPKIIKYYKDKYASSALIDLNTIDIILSCNKINKTLSIYNKNKKETEETKNIEEFTKDIKTQILNGFYRLYLENKTNIIEKIKEDKNIGECITNISDYKTYLTDKLFQEKVKPIRENILKYKSLAMVLRYIFKNVSNKDLITQNNPDTKEELNYTIIKENLKKVIKYLTQIDNVYKGTNVEDPLIINVETSDIMNNAKESKKWFEIFNAWIKYDNKQPPILDYDKLKDILFDYNIITETKYDEWSYYELDSYKDLLNVITQQVTNQVDTNQVEEGKEEEKEQKEGEEGEEEGEEEEEITESKNQVLNTKEKTIEEKSTILSNLKTHLTKIEQIINNKYKTGSVIQQQELIRKENQIIYSSNKIILINKIIEELDKKYKPEFVVDQNIDLGLKNPQSLVKNQPSSSQMRPSVKPDIPNVLPGKVDIISSPSPSRETVNPPQNSFFDFLNFGNPVPVNSGGKRSSRRKNRNNRKTR